MKPHLCPKCLGEKRVPVDGAISTGPFDRACPTCAGAGVLWGPEPSAFAPKVDLALEWLKPCLTGPLHDFEWTGGEGLTQTFTTNPRCKRCGKLHSDLQNVPMVLTNMGEKVADLPFVREPRIVGHDQNAVPPSPAKATWCAG